MERTAAMKTYVAAYVVILINLVLFLLNVLLGIPPLLQITGADDPIAFVIPLIGFGVVMLAAIAAAVVWQQAPRAPWFWLVAAIPGVLFFVTDVPVLVQALTAPRSALEVVVAAVVIAAFFVLVWAAFVSFGDARRRAV